MLADTWIGLECMNKWPLKVELCHESLNFPGNRSSLLNFQNSRFKELACGICLQSEINKLHKLYFQKNCAFDGLGSLGCSELEMISETLNSLTFSQVSLDGESAHCKASTYTWQHNTEKCRHTFIPQVGFKLTIPVFSWSKTTWSLSCSAIFPRK